MVYNIAVFCVDVRQRFVVDDDSLSFVPFVAGLLPFEKIQVRRLSQCVASVLRHKRFAGACLLAENTLSATPVTEPSLFPLSWLWVGCSVLPRTFSLRFGRQFVCGSIELLRRLRQSVGRA